MRRLVQLLGLLVLCAIVSGGTAAVAGAEPVSAAPGPGAPAPSVRTAWDRAGSLDDLHQLAQAGHGRWIRVSLSRLTAQAMVGNQVVYTTPITAGTPAWPTPTGTFRILLPGVLYTQYFTPAGHALHYNYWSPPEAFGRWAGSHGCVGLRLDDAAYVWGFATVGTPVVITY